MPTIAAEVTEEDAAGLAAPAKRRAEAARAPGAAPHGALTVPGPLATLAEDAAPVVRRPGSWEGPNMAQASRGHGYP